MYQHYFDKFALCNISKKDSLYGNIKCFESIVHDNINLKFKL